MTNAGARRRRLGTKINVADFSAPAIATDADYQFSTTTKPYRFVSLENLPVHLALVVIPDLAARPRKDGKTVLIDSRKRICCGLKIPRCGLTSEMRSRRELTPLSPEYKTRLLLGRGQMIVDFAEPSHMIESRHAYQDFRVISGHRRHDHCPGTGDPKKPCDFNGAVGFKFSSPSMGESESTDFPCRITQQYQLLKVPY